MTKFFLFFLCICIASPLTAHSQNRLIVVYGASCSGKSTLSKALAQSLGSTWLTIDRDDVIEREQKQSFVSPDTIEKNADILLCQEIQKALGQDSSIVVDTQMPLPVIKAFSAYDPILAFVYAPLSYLIERDIERSIVNRRTERLNYWSRRYVIETYAGLLSDKPCSNNAIAIDYISVKDLKNDIFRYQLSNETSKFFIAVVQSQSPIGVYPKFPCDVTIKSHTYSIQESVNAVTQILSVKK